MLDTRKILFIDTEHNEETYAPESIQLLYDGEYTEITSFTPEAENRITELWNKAEAIVAWGALFDIGKLSAMFTNSFRWIEEERDGIKTASWNMKLFHNNYKVRRIGGHRNLIKTMNRDKRTKSHKEKGVKSTPIIDLLKLWSILIENGEHESLKLKEVLKRWKYTGDIIKYSKEAAKTSEYRKQDVLGLEFLMKIFLQKVENVLDLGSYSWLEWADIKSPATFTKASYAKRYPLKDYQTHNNARLASDDKLEYALSAAYNGGITLSLHRGKVYNTAWVDISGAYANTIKHENTDKYLLFDYQHYEGSEWDYKKFNCILRVKCNFVIQSVNKSLKLFAVKEPSVRYVWYKDVEACSKIYPDYEYEVLEGWEIIPLCPVTGSLVEEWIKGKDAEGVKKKAHDKSFNETLYQYYKFLSNTSYGIKAQRKPFTTIHTNMAIAGMITSNVHNILCTIISEVRKLGYEPKYSDTDSCCFAQGREFTEEDMNHVLTTINKAIYPYEVTGEGYNKTTTILSLKRYISVGGTDKDKVRVHGRGRYIVNEAELRKYIETKECEERTLKLSSFAGNTKRTLDQIISLYPNLEHYHPFMFKEGVQTDRSLAEFMEKWYTHIDTKAYPFSITGDADESFSRNLHIFTNGFEAEEFFTHYMEETEESYRSFADDVNDTFRSYDSELQEDFTDLE